MKVFTVGLDEKAAQQASEHKVALPIETPSPVPSPLIAVERRRRPSGFKCVVVSLLALFFILLFAMTLSEIAYNRQRDENFFRLRWAELKQRMGYWDLGERLASRHNNLEALPQTQTTTELPAPSTEDSPSTGDSRLDFLRALLSKIRESAEKAGVEGTMQVSLVQVDPPASMPERESLSQSLLDGFGEVHQPEMNALSSRRGFGPSPNEDFYQPHHNTDYDFNPRPDFILPWARPQQPSNFLPSFQQPSFFFPPRDRFPPRPEWTQNNDDSNEANSADARPQMRITHHFDGENAAPQRVVTELFGDNAPDVLRQLLSQQFQPQQQQMQQQQQPDFAPPPRWTDNSASMPAMPTFAFAQQQQQEQQQEQWQQPWQPTFDFAQPSPQQWNVERPWYQSGDDSAQPTWDLQPSAFQSSQFSGPSNSFPQQQNQQPILPNFNMNSWNPDMAAVDMPPAQPDVAPWQQMQSEPSVETPPSGKSAISFLPLREAEGEAAAQAAAAETHDSSAPEDSSEAAIETMPVEDSAEAEAEEPSEPNPSPELGDWKADAVSLPEGVHSLPALDTHAEAPVHSSVGDDEKIDFPAVHFPFHDGAVDGEDSPQASRPLFLQVDDPHAAPTFN